jgi:hypothetical protein
MIDECEPAVRRDLDVIGKHAGCAAAPAGASATVPTIDTFFRKSTRR